MVKNNNRDCIGSQIKSNRNSVELEMRKIFFKQKGSEMNLLMK